jgi:hypothetical protein
VLADAAAAALLAPGMAAAVFANDVLPHFCRSNCEIVMTSMVIFRSQGVLPPSLAPPDPLPCSALVSLRYSCYSLLRPQPKASEGGQAHLFIHSGRPRHRIGRWLMQCRRRSRMCRCSTS